MLITIKELRFKGIGRFVDEQVINFDSLGNLVQVDGINNNTGGSSGAGKSTVFNALDFLFGFNKLPTTVLKSRLTEDFIWVKATGDCDGKELVIARDKKLYIKIGNEEYKGSNKISEEELDKILGMSRELFRKIMHKRQKEPGFFLSMGPTDVNKFLMDCLGLSGFKAKIELLDKKIKDLETLKGTTFTALEAAKSALKATQDAAALLGNAPEQEVDAATVEALKARWKRSEKVLESILSSQQLDKDHLELERPQLVSTPFDRSKIEDAERKQRDIKKQIDALQNKERERQQAVAKTLYEAKNHKTRLLAQVEKGETAAAEAAKIASEIKKIRSSICPTCEQNWATETAKAKEVELLNKIKTLKDIITIGTTASQGLEAANNGICAAEMELTPQEDSSIPVMKQVLVELDQFLALERQKETTHQVTEATHNRSILAAFAAKQKALSERHATEIPQYSGQEALDRRNYEAAESRLKTYNEAVTRYNTSKSNLFQQSEYHKQKCLELDSFLAKINKDLAKTEELKRGVKSYLSCSFDDALTSIGDSATKLIRAIPNMQTATIQLEGLRETNDGKLKEEVNAVLHMDGEENVDIRSLSGGEGTSADLAIDLAVIDLIEYKCNKGINLFVLDEPFNGLEAVNCEAILELLKTSSLTKKILIVDHSPEVKAMVESSITVVRTGATSQVQQA